MATCENLIIYTVFLTLNYSYFDRRGCILCTASLHNHTNNKFLLP